MTIEAECETLWRIVDSQNSSIDSLIKIIQMMIEEKGTSD